MFQSRFNGIHRRLFAPSLIFTILAGSAHAYRAPNGIEELDMAYVLDDVMTLMEWDWIFSPAVITVPDDYPSISEALDHAAYYNQKILVKESPDGEYTENVVILAEDFSNLTIEGACGSLPEVTSAEYGNPVFHIINEDNVTTTINIRNLTITGASGGDIAGVQVSTSDDDWDAVTTTVNLSRLHITDCSVGIQTGVRTGVSSCSTGKWGSIGVSKLAQPITAITVDRCSVVGCYSDGMNLWRAEGEILSTIIANNGGEGVHTTNFKGTVRNSIMVGHSDNQMHLHFPREVFFVNNFVVAGYGIDPYGDGLVVEGTDHDADPLPIIGVYNNVFAGNDNAGARIGFARLVESTSPCEEEIIACRARFFNNVFFENAPQSEKYAMHSSHQDANELSNWMAYNLFYNNNGMDYDSSVISPGAGNVFGTNPMFTANPDDEVLESVIDAPLIRNAAMGVLPQVSSPLVDAGHPVASLNDVSSYAAGAARNDIGIFGGPWASPGPLSAGARLTRCLWLIADFALDRIFIQNVLYSEPGGDPWADKIVYTDPQSQRTLTLYWVPEGMNPRWLGDARDVQYLPLGDKRVKLYRTPEERAELNPVTARREFEVKQWPYEEDVPLPPIE